MKLSLLAAALVAITLVACDSGSVSEDADPTKIKLDNAMQAEEAAEVAAEAAAVAVAEVEDEYSGKAVLPSHNLDGNGNPITDGKDPTKLMH